ncbi:MAG: MarR family winged helix-turn-helix transcriptional regulator [Inquilinaceae bacterium]
MPDTPVPNTVAPPVGAPSLVLEDFLPYRLSVLANTVSRALARLYRDEHGLSVAQWRLLAILARFGAMSSNEVAARAAMDKVQISRAVAGAVARGLITRGVDRGDRRRAVLRLTEAGRRLHDRIVPRAKACEARLLDALGPREAAILSVLLDRLQTRASDLDDSHDDP